MEAGEVWRRVESLETTTEAEAVGLLRSLLEATRDRAADPEAALPDAAVTVMSALGRVDQRGVERRILLDELAAEGRWAPELVELLRRLLDRAAPDRLASAGEALRALAEAEPAIRAHQSAASWAATRPPEPVPEDPEKLRRQRRLAGVGCAALVLALAGMLVYKLVSEHVAASTLAVAAEIPGTTVEARSRAEAAGSLRTAASWASRAISASSTDWMTRDHAFDDVVSWPDIERVEVVDENLRAWKPSAPDAGTEWIELEWNLPVTARTVVVVEGTGPGAVIAVDDIVDLRESTLGAHRYERLWSGRSPAADEPGRYLLLHLVEPRTIDGLRIVLDTSLVPGESSIDTVGLIAAD
ncbi:MAG TPA: hypothetical protein VLA66_10125 [Thermoanaerobaculia bacterium]|nr:hypothetical protein [Thermoanaerobaculia bacterium]